MKNAINVDSNLNLNYSQDRAVEKAYIITLKDDSVSERLSKRCQVSCQNVGMPFEVFHAYNGRNEKIITPDHLKDKDYMKWVKIMDHNMSSGEIAVYLSHFALWCHCITIDKPIVILEHDAIMLQKFTDHQAYNNIVYLGSAEQYKESHKWPVTPIPMFASLNKNYLFLGRAHAYSIDPQVAKNLVAYTISRGIVECLDVAVRSDQFGMIQLGLFAYNEDDETTIMTRKPNVRLTEQSVPEPSIDPRTGKPVR
jgi:GR25 family glycosyltransferase involved in LPS biosynthesis